MSLNFSSLLCILFLYQKLGLQPWEVKRRPFGPSFVGGVGYSLHPTRRHTLSVPANFDHWSKGGPPDHPTAKAHFSVCRSQWSCGAINICCSLTMTERLNWMEQSLTYWFEHLWMIVDWMNDYMWGCKLVIFILFLICIYLFDCARF